MTIQHTPNYNLPYPQASDPADGPAQIGGLATATETALNGFDARADSVDTQLTQLAAAHVLRARLRVAAGTVVQTIPPSDWTSAAPLTTVAFDDIAEDHNAGTAIADPANDRLVIPKAGVWLLQTTVCFNNKTDNGAAQLNVAVAGGTIAICVQQLYNYANFLTVSRAWSCTVGQFVTARVSCNLGGGALRSASGATPQLEATYIGPTP